MAELLNWREDVPADFSHGFPEGLSDQAMALQPIAIWSRIEYWTGRRWAKRPFEAIISGPGEWIAPVEPVTISTLEIWREQWETVALVNGPLGLELGCATYRATGTAGDDKAAPLEVLEAYRRLAEYLAEAGGEHGAIRSITSGEMSISFQREKQAMAHAMQSSGAADLLRPYRRLK